MSSESAIEVLQVGKTYRLYAKPSDRLKQILFGQRRRYYHEFKALQDVDFSLQRGEAMGIVGVNGAGKSTLLQLIAGTIQPSSGSVKTRGRVAALLELGSGFNPEFTGRENIFLNAATLGLDRREIEQRLDSIIEFSGVGAHIDQPVKTYSSGMYVRLAFSIATSVDPDILIIDEALSVGDGAFARKSFDRIMQIKERGATVLFCSHTLFHVEVFCDKALWMHQGQVQAYGQVSQVLGRYQEFLDGLNDKLGDQSPATQVSVTGELATAEQPSPASAEPDSPPAVPGAARITAVRVQLDEQQGDELYGEAGVSTLRMEIDFASDPALPAPTAALVISSDAGRILATQFSVAGGSVMQRDALGYGTAVVEIPRLPMNKGRFRVGAYLLCERGVHVYQWIDPVAHINLHRESHDQGYFMLHGQWSSLSG